MQQIGRVLERSEGQGVGYTILTETGVRSYMATEVVGDVRVGDMVGGPPWKTLARPSEASGIGTGDAVRWLLPNADGQSRFSLLRQRQKMALAIRQWFDEQDFLEVASPVWVKGACPDGAIDSVMVGDRVLVSSTEYQLKRMIAGGCPRIVSFGPNFRVGEISPVHNPEFTMIEWARIGAPLEKIEEDAREILLAAAGAIRVDSTVIDCGDYKVDLAGPWERCSVKQAWSRYLGMDGIDGKEGFDFEEIRTAAQQAAHLAVPESFLADFGDLVSYLVDAVSVHLGKTRPTILTDWPQWMTSSTGSVGSIAERSEIFVGGLELADGFPFLTDAQQQRISFAEQQQRRRQSGKPEVVLDERYVLALEQGMPPGAGMAMGFDRLVMLLSGQSQLRQVLPFSWDEL